MFTDKVNLVLNYIDYSNLRPLHVITNSFEIHTKQRRKKFVVT